MTTQDQVSNLPVRKWRFWGILFILFSVIMLLTMWKDLWLTGEKPNVLFYIVVPILTILGGVICMCGAGKINKQRISFLTLFAISLGANTVMQVVENITKIIYYKIWDYPGILYVLLVIPFGFLLLAFGLVRWGKVKVWPAVFLTIADFVGSMAVGGLLTEVIGITTPGS